MVPFPDILKQPAVLVALVAGTILVFAFAFLAAFGVDLSRLFF